MNEQSNEESRSKDALIGTRTTFWVGYRMFIDGHRVRIDVGVEDCADKLEVLKYSRQAVSINAIYIGLN